MTTAASPSQLFAFLRAKGQRNVVLTVSHCKWLPAWALADLLTLVWIIRGETPPRGEWTGAFPSGFLILPIDDIEARLDEAQLIRLSAVLGLYRVERFARNVPSEMRSDGTRVWVEMTDEETSYATGSATL